MVKAIGQTVRLPHRYRSTPELGLCGCLRQLLSNSEEAGLKADPLALYRKALNVPIARTQISAAFTPEFVRAG
jgi:hypothetical protein